MINDEHIEEAEKLLKQKQRKTFDRALVAGGKAEKLNEMLDSVQEQMAQSALLEVVVRSEEPQRSKGPARRKRPKTDKRKAQRQARKRNR